MRDQSVNKSCRFIFLALFLTITQCSALIGDIHLSNLAGPVGFSINGAAKGDQSGYSVKTSGDVNGDGVDDVIVGANFASPVVSGTTRTTAGISYVLFGRSLSVNGVASFSNIELLPLNSAGSTLGFAIFGAASLDLSGYSVSGAGDVNGDGLADVIVGANWADPFVSGTTRTNAGISYVIFGRNKTTNLTASYVNIDLLPLNTAGSTLGFAILGASENDNSGRSVSAAGDVNGDGLADVIVGAYGANPVVSSTTRSAAGISYVIFGRSLSVNGASSYANIDLLPLKSAGSTLGFAIWGASVNDNSGYSVSNAGDVNGDGLADVIVGSGYGDPVVSGTTRSDAGISYVLFGRSKALNLVASYANIDLLALNTAGSALGFAIIGAVGSDYSGFSVSIAGDVNGDGLSDVIVGARYASPVVSGTTRTNAGLSNVVFGRLYSTGSASYANIDLLPLNTAGSALGFVIQGAVNNHFCGWSVSTAGDVNGDGLADMIVGAYRASSYAGISYVIYGRRYSAGNPTWCYTNIDLAAITPVIGFRILGATAADFSGWYVGAAGDVNKDGVADVITGAFNATGTHTGASYVIFGVPPTPSPTSQPSSQPSGQPSSQPSRQPSSQPSRQPTARPSTQPSVQPSRQPTCQPTCQPSIQPSWQPTTQPTSRPSEVPSRQPSAQPSAQPQGAPSTQPSAQPSRQPSVQPSAQPSTQPSSQPSVQPSAQPVLRPTSRPSMQPSSRPSAQPSTLPSTQPSSQPTSRPSAQPSALPSLQPLSQPSTQPSVQPSAQPVLRPTSRPSAQPSNRPSAQPYALPSSAPSAQPSQQPSSIPSMQPSSVPSRQPSAAPSAQPTARPSVQPTQVPSTQPTTQPSNRPSAQPTVVPSVQPTAQPVATPSAVPSVQPSGAPSSQPTSQPSCVPSAQPSSQPVSRPSAQPSAQPSVQPSSQPSVQPSAQPVLRPTSRPSAQPSSRPSAQPSTLPSAQPSSQPSSQPSGQPSGQPTSRPSSQPSRQPTIAPSAQPSSQPSGQPSSQPSQQPRTVPSAQPTGQPTIVPSAHPTISLTGEWATLVSAAALLTNVNYANGYVWSCSAVTSMCFLFDVPTGEAVNEYKIDWESVIRVLSTSVASQVVLIGHDISSGIVTSEVATCTTDDQGQLNCQAQSYYDTNFLAASYVPYPNAIVYVGWNNMHTTITMADVLTGVIQSYLYTASNVKALTLSQIQSPPAFVGSIVAGTAIRATATPVNYIVTGMFRTDGGSLRGMVVMPVSGDILNSADLVNAMALEYTGPDSFIAGGLQLADITGTHAYLLRANALFNTISYCVHYRSMSRGRRALSTGTTVSQSVVRGMVRVDNALFMIVAATHHNVTALTVLKTSIIDGTIDKQVHVFPPNNTNLTCTDIAVVNSFVSIVCTLQRNISSVQSVVILADQALSFSKLPAEFARNEQIIFQMETLHFQRTVLSITQTAATLATSTYEFNTADQTPTRRPSLAPSYVPTSLPSSAPSSQPSSSPTAAPSVSARPTSQPSSAVPTITHRPTVDPTVSPTRKPSAGPTARPSFRPTVKPSARPTAQPSVSPTARPSASPTLNRTPLPSVLPTHKPSHTPTRLLTRSPSETPTTTQQSADGASRGSNIPSYVVGASMGGGLGILLIGFIFYKVYEHTEEEKARELRRIEYMKKQVLLAEQRDAEIAKYFQDEDERNTAFRLQEEQEECAEKEQSRMIKKKTKKSSSGEGAHATGPVQQPPLAVQQDSADRASSERSNYSISTLHSSEQGSILYDATHYSTEEEEPVGVGEHLYKAMEEGSAVPSSDELSDFAESIINSSDLQNSDSSSEFSSEYAV